MIDKTTRIYLSVALPVLILFWSLIYAKGNKMNISVALLPAFIVIFGVIISFQPWSDDWDKKYRIAISVILSVLITFGNAYLAADMVPNSTISGLFVGAIISVFLVLLPLQPWN